MRYVRNEKGIALVLALILSLIALAIISTLVYFVTQGTEISGFQKRYHTAREAAEGGVELATKEVISRTIGSTDLTTDRANIQNDLVALNLLLPATTTNACLSDKLQLSTANWANCGADNTSLVPTTAPDVTFTLFGVAPQPNFDVFAKIVDTVSGNSNRSGIDLEGIGVVETTTGMVTPKHFPIMYRVDIQAQRAGNPDERANLSVLYAY
jgi:Flp pilus assembly pilin Flp